MQIYFKKQYRSMFKLKISMNCAILQKRVKISTREKKSKLENILSKN